MKGGMFLPSQGSIIARVYTSDAYIPLQDAPVIFTATGADGEKNLIAIRNTDSSGLTAPVYVDTPDPDQSLTPGLSLKPYASVDIQASYPGFQSIQTIGVQVFPGVETIQGLQLQPINAYGENEPSAVLPQGAQDL